MGEPSTDALLNAGGGSTEGVQDLLASLMDSGFPEGIAAEIQHSRYQCHPVADVIKHMGIMSIKLVPFILPHCGAVGAR